MVHVEMIGRDVLYTHGELLNDRAEQWKISWAKRGWNKMDEIKSTVKETRATVQEAAVRASLAEDEVRTRLRNARSLGVECWTP